MDKQNNGLEQKNFFKKFDLNVQKYVKDGTSLPQAVSLVAKEFNINPYKIINDYYPEIKPEELNSYKDIKTEEGSFVTLKNDSNQNHYEVININNKDAIVLRNTDNNEEITASESEITPVITENKMNKLNEAQYNISIDGLETQDAATLSQMLNLASQAESSNASMIAPDSLQSDMAVNPMPMDMESGMPMDMEEPVVDDMSMEEPVVDDIEFDEELPMGEEPMGEEPMGEEPMDMESPIDDAMNSNNLEDGEMSMDDMIDNNMFDNPMEEEFDYDALIKEALDSIKESEEIIPADDFIDDNGELEGQQVDYAEEISESDDFDDEISEALRIAGVELTEKFDSDESMDKGFDENQDAIAINNGTYGKEFENELYDLITSEMGEDFFSDEEDDGYEARNAIEDFGRELDGFDENKIDEYYQSMKEIYQERNNPSNFDDEISETLRLAGVKLDEEVAEEPTVSNVETINKDLEDQEPEYQEVDTTTFGKEASEGMKQSMTFESTLDKNKIKSIYETAKSMYAKKDTNDWLSLDRRYIEKLIKEGVCYEKASKIILEAKKGA